MLSLIKIIYRSSTHYCVNYNKMIAKSIHLIILYLILLVNTKKLFQIEQRFKERQPTADKIVLPEISSQSTLADELSVYAELHQSKQFKQFKADPEYSSQILLKKDGVWSQSIYFTGKQLSNLLMEVTIVHKGDHHNHDKEAINAYLINTATNEFVFAGRIKHMKLFKYEIQSQLYELRVAYDWSKEIDKNITSTDEVLKHISISIDIDPIVPQQETPTQKDEKAAAQKLRVIKNDTDRIFMSSLQIWDEIQANHRQFYKNQEEVYYRAYFELVVVFAANFIEWLLLRRTLKLKPLI